MDGILHQKIETFVCENIGSFHEARIRNIQNLKLKTLLENKNPYLFRAKNLNAAANFVTALLDARLSSSEEGSFGNFLESFAVFVATQCAGGQKSPATGIDIDLTKDDVRYLISVKSGKNWGNSSQYKASGQHFADAVKVVSIPRQSRGPYGVSRSKRLVRGALTRPPVALCRLKAACQFQICIWSIRLSSVSWLRM
jgi:hypothetical protein